MFLVIAYLLVPPAISRCNYMLFEKKNSSYDLLNYSLLSVDVKRRL